MYIIVIDTQTPYSVEQFHAYRTWGWITKDAFYMLDAQNHINSSDIRNYNGVKINSAILEELMQKITPLMRFIGPFLASAAFFGLLFFYGLRLTQFLLLALIFMLGIKLFGKSLTFGNSYKMIVQGSTLAVITDVILIFTRHWTYFDGFPFLFSIITLGTVVVNTISVTTSRTPPVMRKPR